MYWHVSQSAVGSRVIAPGLRVGVWLGALGVDTVVLQQHMGKFDVHVL